jgi:hypothetical protein
MALTADEAGAVNRIAATLGPCVTTQAIDEVTVLSRVEPLVGVNKVRKIQILLEYLLTARKASAAVKAVATILMEAHARTVEGKARLTVAAAEGVVADMRTLRLPTNDFRGSGWKKGLIESPRVETTPFEPPIGTTSRRSQPQAYDDLLHQVRGLMKDGVDTRQRGTLFEQIVFHILEAEGLQPQKNVVNPGEEIDLVFSLEHQHFLVECRWRADPQGGPVVREFMEKVRRKAEGTFGVLLSMSGFVRDIDEHASRGTRLNCVGLTGVELMPVLEGHTTFADAVLRARLEASSRSTFYRPPR